MFSSLISFVKDQDNVIFVSALFCAVVFAGTALWCFAAKKPVHFWAGDKIPEESVVDVRLYNRANGFMWLFYAACWIIVSVIGLFNVKAGGIGAGICSVGVLALIFIYSRIKEKYSV